MKRASIVEAIAERRSHAFGWLNIAADRRRAGLINEARLAVSVSRLWPAPRIPS